MRFCVVRILLASKIMDIRSKIPVLELWRSIFSVLSCPNEESFGKWRIYLKKPVVMQFITSRNTGSDLSKTKLGNLENSKHSKHP